MTPPPADKGKTEFMARVAEGLGKAKQQSGLTVHQAMHSPDVRARSGMRTIGDAMRHRVDLSPAKQAAKPVDPAEVETESTGSDQTATDTVAGGADKNTDPEETRIARARNALKRVGWKDADFEHFSRDQVLRRAQIVENAQGRMSATKAENAKLKAENAALKANQGHLPPSNGVPPQTGVASPSLDIDKLVASFGELDEDASSRAKAILTPIFTRLAQVEQRVQERPAEVAPGDADVIRRDVQATLAESVPQLANDDVFEEFERVSEQLKTTLPQYADADTDAGVAERLFNATIRAMELEDAAERDEPTSAQREPGRGFLDVPGSARPRALPKRSELDVFKAAVDTEIRKQGLRAG